MKRILIISIILTVSITVTVPTRAQWNYFDLGVQVTAFGAHDSSLFIACNTDVGTQHVYRYTVAHGYDGYADTGIDFTQGDITSFASLGPYIFAGMTDRGGPGPAYRSSNDGGEWVVNASWNIGTNGKYLFGSSSTSVYRSTDSGNDWNSIPCPYANNFASIGINIFATSDKGVWGSTDTGNHWTQLFAPFVGTMLTMDSLLFITNGGKTILRSTDSGMKWDTVIVDSAGTVPEMVSGLATNGKLLFAATPSGVFFSLDGGNTWKAIENTGLANPNVTAIGVFDTMIAIDVSYDNGNRDAEYTHSIPQLTDTVDSTKGAVKEPAIADSITVYPNPSTGTVTIGGIPMYSITMTNIAGTQMLTLPKIDQSSITLDISPLPSGTYFVQIGTADGTTLRKIVVEK